MKRVLCYISLFILAFSLAWGGPEKVDPTGLVADYPFTGNANDNSGHGHNGTVYGAVLTMDRFGNPNSAYLFDGVNDYIQVPYSAELNPSGCITVAAWFKADTWGGTSYSNAILSTELCSPDKGYGLRGGDGTATFFISCSGSWISAVSAPGSVLVGQWYFLVGTYDGSAVRVYLNGTESAAVGYVGPLTSSTADLHIGSYVANTTFFDGSIDDIRIYSRALSNTEITELYNESVSAPGVPTPISPINNQFVNSHDVNFLWHASDSVVSYCIQASPDSTFGGIEFDQVVVVPDTATVAHGLIFSNYFWRVRANRTVDTTAWSSTAKFRIDTIPPLPPTLVSPTDGENVTDSLQHCHWNESVSALHYHYDISSDSLFSVLEDSITIDTLGFTVAMPLDDGEHWWRVRACDTAKNWSGNSKFFRFNVNTFKPVQLAPGNGSTIAQPRPSFDWKDSRSVTSYSIEVAYDSLFTVPVDSALVMPSTYTIDDSLPDSTYYWRVRAFKIPNDTSEWSDVWKFTIVAGVPSNSLVAYYPFSGNANDTSGYGHHGTVYGAALTTDRFGNPNRAYLFDGLNDYIQVPYDSILNPSSRITIAAWFKADTWGGTSYSNAILSTELCSPDKGYGLRGGDGTATFFISCSGSWIHAVTAPGSVLAGQWYFLAGTYDGTAVRVYLNGTEASEVGYAGPLTSSTANLCIGSYVANTTFFDGVIDDIRIFSRALTPDEIDTLYHEGGYAGIEELPDPLVPGLTFKLLPAQPNPARAWTEVCYQLPAAAKVKVEIFNIAGQRLATLVNAKQEAGWNQLAWDLRDDAGRRVANGIYFLRLTSGALSTGTKITVIR